MEKQLSITFIKPRQILVSGGSNVSQMIYDAMGNDYEHTITKTWTISRDAITDEKSTFVIDAQIPITRGMICFATEMIPELEDSKITEHAWHPLSKPAENVDGTIIPAGPLYQYTESSRHITPLFTGIVDTFEIKDGGTQSVSVRDLSDVFNFDGLLSKGSGSDLIKTMTNWLSREMSRMPLINNGYLWMFFLIEETKHEQIPWTYQPNDPPAITNMRDFMTNMFKRYAVYLEGTGIRDLIVRNPNGNGDTKRLVSVISHIEGPKDKEKLVLKNNTTDFIDWNLYITPGGINSANALYVIDSKTPPDGKPVPEDWHGPEPYLMTEDGEILHTGTVPPDANVQVPLIWKIKKLDYSMDDHPTPAEVAHEEMSMSQYQHEITFSLDVESALLKFSDFKLGMQADLVHDGVLYKSILTGYEFDQSSRYVKLRFGNVRSTLQSVLDNL